MELLVIRHAIAVDRSPAVDDADDLERLVRSRAGGKWLASEDFAETIGYLRRFLQSNPKDSAFGLTLLGFGVILYMVFVRNRPALADESLPEMLKVVPEARVVPKD